MDLVWLQEFAGEARAVALAGLAVGLMFGWAAQRSRFCLRAAVVEFARGNLGGKFGPRLSVWLLAFSTALRWGLFWPPPLDANWNGGAGRGRARCTAT